jgi:chromosome segregation ATPase
MDTTQITPIIIAIVAALPGLLAFIAQLRKEKVDIVKVSQEAAIGMIKPLQEEVSRLRILVNQLEAELIEKDKKIDELNVIVNNLVSSTQEKIQKATDPLMAEITRLRTEVKQLNTMIRTKDNKIAELVNLITDRNERISELEKECLSLKERMGIVEKKNGWD